MDHAAVATRPTSDSLDIPGRQYFSDNRRADLNKCTIIIREKNEGVVARRGVVLILSESGFGSIQGQISKVWRWYSTGQRDEQALKVT